MNRLLKNKECNSLLGGLSADYRFFAPVRRAGRGRLSDTDLITYDQISSVEEIVWDEKTLRSAKEIMFPITETLMRFDQKTISQPSVVDNRGIVIFCRSCDIHAVSRLDKIFLDNGTSPDPYYERLREKIHFVLMECADPFKSCFCVSMKTNIPEKFIAAVREVDGGLKVLSQRRTLVDKLSTIGSECEFELHYPKQNGTEVFPPQTLDMPSELYDHEMWDEYSGRCIACGRCNTSCPTCSCFSVHDVMYDKDSGQAGERRRVWAGCHIDGFTDMAGGMEFRKSSGARMRFKTFHKIYDYRKRFGENMCVGCGRCDDICPEYISFSNCINKVSEQPGTQGESL
ncbi:anaerobic sulfite reductase subunit AsrA [Chitinispirillales bacterium ANBcel5]|uniref:anaerobic sulfite reductase subunit AsrA n=1 Tax=Cellulosispirillum alkaliphilum TaxID=3039283 RepID=UPI002A596101|nr:anaerobic sulfite reductase subunit AsrA [Chitinispirillales bacterium ANBcel5]